MPRRQRFDQGRNLQNLRVIPTLNKNSPTVIESLSPSHKIYTLLPNRVVHPTLVPIPKHNQAIASGSVADPRQYQSFPSASTVSPGLNQLEHQQLPPALPAVNNKPSRIFKKRRNRKNRQKKIQELPYQWYDSYNLNQVANPVTNDFEKVSNVSEAKVENVSDTKVGNVSEAKVGNVSEAKVGNVSEAKVGNVAEAKIKNVHEAKVETVSEAEVEHMAEGQTEENYFEEVEVASVEGEVKQEVLVGYRKTKQQYLSYKKKKCFFRPKIFNLGERTFVNCLNMHDDVDVDVVSEAEYEYENENLDRNESQDEKFVEVKESEQEANKIKNETEKVSVKNGKVPEKVLRKYKTSIESSNELNQGECLIQSSLDTWKSHLLGLEYLIEIQNENKDAVLKYNCILCDTDVSFQGLPAIHVMNHVNDRKHVVRYLEKHFSAHGFKFSENNSYPTDALKRIAEEINHKLGYYFMCVTTSAHYIRREQDFKNIIKCAYHPNDKDLKLDETLVEKVLNFNLEEIQNILSDIIGKIEPLENDNVCGVEVVATAVDNSQSHFKNATSLEHCDKKSESRNLSLKMKKSKFNVSKSYIGKGKFCRPFAKGKGKSAFSSYLKSKYAKAAMQKKPLRGFSSYFNKESSQNENSKTNDPDEIDSSQAVGDSTQQSVENASEVDAAQTKEVSRMSVEESVKADTDSKETDVNSSDCDLGQHAHKNREKVPLKATTVHSKHCRKMISTQVISAAIVIQCV